MTTSRDKKQQGNDNTLIYSCTESGENMGKPYINLFSLKSPKTAFVLLFI